MAPAPGRRFRWTAFASIALAAVAAAQTPSPPVATTSPATSPASRPAEPLVTIKPGHLPIILSSPHGGRTPIVGAPPRKGVGVRQFVIVTDGGTAELTEAIADALEKELGGRPYVVIARFQRLHADANRPADGAYESPAAAPHYGAFHAGLAEACADVKKRWGRGLLLDIHGQGVDAEGIFRGTADGQAVRDLLAAHGQKGLTGPDSVFGRLKAAGLRTHPAWTDDAIGKEEKFNGGFITRHYGSHRDTAIDAIQLEFGSKFRNAAGRPQAAKDVASATAAFARKFLPATRPAR